MAKRSSPAGSGRGKRGASERRVQSRSTPSEANPGSLWTCGPMPSLPPHTGSATGHLIAPVDHHTVRHIQVYFGVDFQALTWNHTKDHNRSRKLCFHHPGHVPVIRGNLDLHFEGAGNGPVIITWIGREHELYSGASPISLVEHCVIFRMIEGSYCSWDLYTTGQLVDGQQQKKKNGFHLTEIESCRLF